MAVKKVSFGIAFKQNSNQTSQAKHIVVFRTDLVLDTHTRKNLKLYLVFCSLNRIFAIE